MAASRWHKVLHDLFSNKTRTALIVLSVAVGLFALGMIVSSRAVLSSEMARNYQKIMPSHGTVRTLQPFGDDFVRSVRDMPGVAQVDARRRLVTRVETNPGEWL